MPTFSELGIEREAFLGMAPTMAAQALASGSPNNNPVVPSVEAVEGLYRQVYA